MPWTRWSSTGSPGIGLPRTISPVAFAGIFARIALARTSPTWTLSLPTKVSTLLPAGGGVSTETCGMPRATACENGRTKRSGVVVIVAMPSLAVCIAAWKSWTSCGPLIPFGAALLSLTPSHAGRGLGPERHLLERVLRRGRGDHREASRPSRPASRRPTCSRRRRSLRRTRRRPARGRRAPARRARRRVENDPDETTSALPRETRTERSQREPRPLPAPAAAQEAVERHGAPG